MRMRNNSIPGTNSGMPTANSGIPGTNSGMLMTNNDGKTRNGVREKDGFF